MLTASVVLYKTNPVEVQSIIKQLSNCSAVDKIFVIDNSSDDCLSQVCLNFEKVVYYSDPTNPGYGAGHNRGIFEAIKTSAVYHLVVNSDINFQSIVIDHLVNVMNRKPECGLIAPSIIDRDGRVYPSRKRLPDPIDMLLRSGLVKNLAASRNAAYEMHSAIRDLPILAPYLSGCFMLFRLAALSEVGFFDERFFLYPEDIDITRRLAVRFLTVYDPRVHVVHFHRAESKKSLRMFLVHVFNMVKYFNKWGWFYDMERKRLNSQAGEVVHGL